MEDREGRVNGQGTEDQIFEIAGGKGGRLMHMHSLVTNIALLMMVFMGLRFRRLKMMISFLAWPSRLSKRGVGGNRIAAAETRTQPNRTGKVQGHEHNNNACSIVSLCWSQIGRTQTGRGVELKW